MKSSKLWIRTIQAYYTRSTCATSPISPSERCVPALPELYRPQIGDFVRNDWGTTIDGMFDRPHKKFEGNETFVEDEKSLKITWDLIKPGLVPVTKFLIELRSSKNLSLWHHLTSVNHTERVYTLKLNDEKLFKLLKQQPTASHSTLEIDENEQITWQMIAAEYAQMKVSMDSVNHMAVQFRVSPVAEFLLGSPGPGSNWIVIEVNKTSTSSRYTWMTLCIVAICVVLTVAGLSLVFRESVSGHLRKTSYLLKKSSRDIFHEPTTECCRLQESSLSSAFSCAVRTIQRRKTISENKRKFMDFNPNSISFIHGNQTHSPPGSVVSSSTLQISPYPNPELRVLEPDSSGMTTIFNNSAVDWITNGEATNMLARSGSLSTPQPMPVISNNGCLLNNSLEQCNVIYLDECPSINADRHSYLNAEELKHMYNYPIKSSVTNGNLGSYRDLQNPTKVKPNTGVDSNLNCQTVCRNFFVHAEHLGQSVYQKHYSPMACGICELTSSYMDHNSITMNHCDYWKHANDYTVHWYPSKQDYTVHPAVDSVTTPFDVRYQSPMVKQNECFVSCEPCLQQSDHMGDYSEVFSTRQHRSVNEYQATSFANTSTLERNHLPAYRQSLQDNAWDYLTCVEPFQPPNKSADPKPKCLSHTTERIRRCQNSVPMDIEPGSDHINCPVTIKHRHFGVEHLEGVMSIPTRNRNGEMVTDFRPSSHFNGWVDSKSNEEIGLTEV
ncbi:hypothetical protein EG68_06092 [Paragonimus skrjabini miyazakii]|uniref:Uncharacterized protein n=1 Tax=Paragonimus skrjabini miyazakii TaxID=59628 RepID=A0A8S9YVZ4_9TREM|nr:hypothetical protein EG68_06092 [Paragonimus skrjabini miyazakii]